MEELTTTFLMIQMTIWLFKDKLLEVVSMKKIVKKLKLFMILKETSRMVPLIIMILLMMLLLKNLTPLLSAVSLLLL